MSRKYPFFAILIATPSIFAQVVTYEAASSFPEDGNGWERSTFCGPERSLDDGCFVQHVEPEKCAKPPSGDRDSYTRPIQEFDGVASFFLEWVVNAEGQSSEILWGAPAVVTAWTFGPVFYGFTISRDEVKFVQDSFAIVLFVPIAPDVPHKYRLEVYGAKLYLWYIDGELIHTGIPGGEFPAHTPSINWRAKSAFLESTVKWDYIRYGVIPETPGDFDSDGDWDLRDYKYFAECAADSGPGGDTGPGCRWADMDGDNDVDLIDFGLFQAAFTGS